MQTSKVIKSKPYVSNINDTQSDTSNTENNNQVTKYIKSVIKFKPKNSRENNNEWW